VGDSKVKNEEMKIIKRKLSFSSHGFFSSFIVSYSLLEEDDDDDEVGMIRKNERREKVSFKVYVKNVTIQNESIKITFSSSMLLRGIHEFM
jgi:hypothetical protein